MMSGGLGSRADAGTHGQAQKRASAKGRLAAVKLTLLNAIKYEESPLLAGRQPNAMKWASPDPAKSRGDTIARLGSMPANSTS